MGEVEISINEEWALRVVHRYDLRGLLRRLRPEGFERHRVVQWPNCSCWSKSGQDRKFNRVLMIFFLITLSLAVINLIILDQLLKYNQFYTWDHTFDQAWLFGFRIGQAGIVLLLVFVAVLAVGVLAKTATRKTCSAPPRREEVQTISALVQQVKLDTM